MGHYFATVLPGLEDVLRDEIRAKIADAEICGTERGKVYFASRLPAEAFLVLRTADNLYRLLHRFHVGPHKIHLANIEREMCQCDLSQAYGNRSGTVGYKVNASRTGKHTYSRFDAAEAAARGIARRDPRYRDDRTGQHEIEFRLDIDQDDAVFSLRLTNAAFRYRKEERRFAAAALRPTVAHALVWLSNPEETDAFVDPCCGSGTILSERLAYPFLRVEGGDLSKEAVDASRDNIGYPDRVSIRHWDARQLPLDSGCIDKIVTNLPFGRQIAADENLVGLYGDMFKEMKRVLRDKGSALCLTDAAVAVQAAADRSGLSFTGERALSLKGLHPTLFSLKKK